MKNDMEETTTSNFPQQEHSSIDNVQALPEIPKKNNRMLIVISVIALTLLGSMAYFVYQNLQLKKQITYLTPTSPQLSPPPPAPPANPMADWKTYTDNNIGFSIKYPSSWTYKLGETNVTSGHVTFDTRLPSSNKNTNYIFEMSLETQADYDQWSKYSTTTTLEPQTINGHSFEKYVVGDLYYSLNYILKQNGKIFRFIFYPFDSSQYPKELQETLNQILSTFQFLDQTSPSPAPSNVKKLTYDLPEGWKTSTDTSNSFEVGYDPNRYRVTPSNLGLSFSYVAHPDSFDFRLLPYGGGSRHSFIYQQLGYVPAPPASEKTKDYHEVEYSYNGWSCLVIYGLYFSASGTTWGMCPVSSSQALFFEGPSSGPGAEAPTEGFIKTIKFLR